MDIIFLLILIVIVTCIKNYRSFGVLPFTPMTLATIFIVALSVNVQNSVAYLDSHPELNSHQVGWFRGYWPLPFFGALLIILGTPIYLGIKTRRKRKKQVF